MSGFQALLAAFFGHQGDDALAGLAAGAGPTALQGKVAFASKSDSKAGQMTKDDALGAALDPGAPTDDKTDALATADATTATAGLSVDAQALAALFAAPVPKTPQVEATTDKAPAGQAASAKDAGVPAVALAAETPTLDIAAAADDAKADATAGQAAAETAGRAKLVDLAEALAAARKGAKTDAAAKPDTTPAAPQAGYRPAAAAAQAAQAAQVQATAEATPDLADANAVATPAVEAQVAEAETPALAPTFGKDRAAVRSGRMDAARKEGESQPLTAPVATDLASAAKPVVAMAAANGFAAQPAKAEAADDKPADAEPAPLKIETTDEAGLAQAPSAPAHASPTTAQAATVAVRGAPETVASLAAQIIKKAEGKATRFDVELHPADLGQVNVRLEIGAHGRLTASMSFENPQAAAELRGRADELQRALENAGFDMSGGLSFDVAGDRGQGRNQADQQAPDGGGVLRGRAFEAALATAGETANAALAGALNAYQSRVAPGLDIRI